MTDTAAFAQSHEILQETATRLIKALGVEMAIFICRSNYWHGVMKIIQERQEMMATATVHHLRPQSVATADFRDDAGFAADDVAIAA